VAVILVIGALVIGTVMLTLGVWFPEWWSVPIAAPKPPVRRVTRVVGFAIVAAGVSIMFLPVSANRSFYGDTVACGSGWQATFTNATNYNSDGYACGHAAFPHLWIAGAVAAVGIGVAFWGASRGRFLGMICLALVVTGSIQVLGLMGSSSMGGV
jgi:hypothetical protein